ncbi:MAG TPA: FecR domain-containing protein [Bacteroidales bacterium]|nr:FecR domain-containing protein [Bacteroidales bacterium]
MALNDLDNERLNRYFKADYSEEDKEYLQKLFSDRNKEDDIKCQIKKKWNELLQENEGYDINLDHILYRIHYEINTKKTGFKNRYLFRNFVKWSVTIAAILALPLLIYSGINFYNNSYKSNTEWVEIKAPAWSKVQFNLPDETIGWLNSSSSLRYRGDYLRDRRITLQGEAYFDVKNNPERPFVVSTNKISITVLGTRFNVASYEDERDIEVVLEEGKLILNDAEMNKSYTMIPNELVKYDKSLNKFSFEYIQPQKYVSWKDGMLIFRNDPIDIVAKRLERWYNIDIELRGNYFGDLRFRATFFDENLEEVLYFMKRSLPINYKIEEGRAKDDGIYLKKKVIITYKNI